MPYQSGTVAREIHRLASANSRPVTPLELIKLTYIAHGWSLGLRGVPLVSENAEAWQYGPVFPELYHGLKHFRAFPVTEVPAIGLEMVGIRDEIADGDKGLIASVFEAYRKLNGVQLSSLTHQPNTPWDLAWRKGKNSVISNTSIESHFKELAKQRAA